MRKFAIHDPSLNNCHSNSLSTLLTAIDNGCIITLLNNREMRAMSKVFMNVEDAGNHVSIYYDSAKDVVSITFAAENGWEEDDILSVTMSIDQAKDLLDLLKSELKDE